MLSLPRKFAVSLKQRCNSAEANQGEEGRINFHVDLPIVRCSAIFWPTRRSRGAQFLLLAMQLFLYSVIAYELFAFALVTQAVFGPNVLALSALGYPTVESLSILVGFTFLGVLLVMPFYVTAQICRARNRSVPKGMFVTFFFGWIATAVLWLGLKTRRPDGALV